MQTRKIKQYCDYREYDLVDIIIDENVSGSVPFNNREGGKKLLEQIQDIDQIVCWKLDRMFRDAKDCLNVVDEFKKSETDFTFLDINVDTSSPSGKMVLTMMSAVAELERNQIRERITSVLRHKKEGRKKYSRHNPLGFYCDKGNLKVDRKEMNVVRRIFRLNSEGVDDYRISVILNDEDIKTKTGKKFHAMTIKKILANDIYSQYIH